MKKKCAWCRRFVSEQNPQILKVTLKSDDPDSPGHVPHKEVFCPRQECHEIGLELGEESRPKLTSPHNEYLGIAL